MNLNESMTKTYYTDLEEAKDAVRAGKAWGAIYISENFTDAFTARVNLGKTDANLNGNPLINSVLVTNRPRF